MLRSVLVSSVISVFCVYAQGTWLRSVEVLSVVPDLALVALVYVSFRNTGPEGQFTGFVSGLAQDALSAAPLGLNALVRTLVGFTYALASGKIFADRVLLPVVLAASATLFKALAISAVALLFPDHVAAYDFLGSALWIEVAYNALAAPILFLGLGVLGPLLVTPRRGY
ncbi:MAG: rod shape-determining protein MreD [Spirochaetia bacterium]|nr:rod shape-determining protein MreD [Spirochaetia bacterium]